ncbi:MAG: hypothetical protein LBH06_09000 [Rikenellaceae bacterium]|jgi:hypothetical protein|nr:hypothetical protein [Rikenellaceae bacterium]
MRKLFVLFVGAIMLCGVAGARVRYFGVKAGINLSNNDYTVINGAQDLSGEVNDKYNISVNRGLMVEYPLSKMSSIRCEVLYFKTTCYGTP